MSVKVIHPDGLTGDAIGLHFEGGVATASSLSKQDRENLAVHGYKFEDIKDKPSDAEKKAAADKAEAEKVAAEAAAKAEAEAKEAADSADTEKAAADAAESLAAEKTAADAPKK